VQQLKIGDRVFQRFMVTGYLGQGAGGNVYIAKNIATGGHVALKIRAKSTSSKDAIRILREAQLAATLVHRNIVRTFDYLEENETQAVVMELCHGKSLREVFRDVGKLTPQQAVAVAVGILDGLAIAHDAGIIHRDLKPENLLLNVEPDGHITPKVLDFGVAKNTMLGSSIVHLTAIGQTVGTPEYMSPEQLRGEVLTPASDLFSVAVTFYEGITGSHPFERSSHSASLVAALEFEVLPDESIPPPLWFAIARALSKQPYERFQSATEFADALLAAASLTRSELSNVLVGLKLPKPTQALAYLDARPPFEKAPKVTVLGAVAAIGICILVALSAVLLWPHATLRSTTLVTPPPVTSLSIASPPTAPLVRTEPPSAKTRAPLRTNVARTPGF
jgi:eukaryotic-like serine/threonine-protein kinase